jgi:hypothetical protein
MTNTKSFSDLAKLEWYLIALNNAKSDPGMSDSLNQIGISSGSSATAASTNFRCIMFKVKASSQGEAFFG